MRRGPKKGHGGAPRKLPENLRHIRVDSRYTPAEYSQLFTELGDDESIGQMQRRWVLERLAQINPADDEVSGWLECNECGYALPVSRQVWLNDYADDPHCPYSNHSSLGELSWTET